MLAPWASVAREPEEGIGWPALYLPVRIPCSIGEKQDLADSELAAGRYDVRLDDPEQRVVLGLVGDERDLQLPSQGRGRPAADRGSIR